jgi:hypothetical protein
VTLSLFGGAAPTGVDGTSSTADQVLGVLFGVTAPATLNAVAFYSPAGAAGLPAAAAVYTQTGQAPVAVDNAPSWSGAAGSGWVTCSMAGYGVTLTPGAGLYCAAAWSGGSLSGVWDEYSVDWWETGSGPGSGGIVNGILHAPDSAGGNIGLLLNGAGAIAYPSNSFEDTNFWIDVLVTPLAAGGGQPGDPGGIGVRPGELFQSHGRRRRRRF